MRNGFFLRDLGRRPGLGMMVACACLYLSLPGWAQGRNPLEFEPKANKEAQKPLSVHASQAPAFSIAAEPLGFSAPGALYLGSRDTLASLDFVDENRLLFTFRVPGLIRREAGDGEEGDQRNIRAVLLSLPAGTVEAETVWTLHDRARYLWMLKDGQFLVRDGAELKQGNAALELKPMLRFPGPLLWVEVDPSLQFLVTGSREPLAGKVASTGFSPRPELAGTSAENQGDLLLRILHRDSGQVMLSTRLRSAIHLPIGSNGYLENLHARGIEWQLNLHGFDGTITPMARLSSTCTPSSYFASQREFIASVCNALGEHRLEAMTSAGRLLWQVQLSDHEVWPLLVFARDGSRLAQESLLVAREINASSPLSTDDIRGQNVRVFDAANGHVALTAQASPPLDAGGNVALSPSGRRVAVLNGGMLEVFELPPAPPVPMAGSAPSGFQNGLE